MYYFIAIYISILENAQLININNKYKRVPYMVFIYSTKVYDIYIYIYIYYTACVAQWLRRQTHKQ